MVMWIIIITSIKIHTASQAPANESFSASLARIFTPRR
jgi:hypothetical protein